MHHFLFYVLLICFLYAVPNDASAAVKTWVGGPSGSWSNPSNWSPAGVPAVATDPSAGDDILFDGSLSATVTIADYPVNASTSRYGLLTLSNGVTVDIASGANTYMYFLNGLVIPAGTRINIGGSTTTFFVFGSRSTVINSSLIYGIIEMKGLGTNQNTNRKEFSSSGSVATKLYGKLIFSGPAANFAGYFVVESGGEFQWDREGTSINSLRFNDGGILNITGIVNTQLVLSNGGTYGGLIIWNNPGQSGNNIGIVPSVGPLVFNVDSIRVVNTGSGSVSLGVTPSYSIGHVEVQSGIVNLGSPSVAPTLANILTDLKITGGTVTGNATFPGDVTSHPITMNIGRDLLISGGSFNLTNRPVANAPGGAMILNVGRHFIKSAGTLYASSPFALQNGITLNGSGAQNLQVDNFGPGTYSLTVFNSSASLGVNLTGNLVMPANVPFILSKGAVWTGNYNLTIPYNNFSNLAGSPTPRFYTNGLGKVKMTGIPASTSFVFPLAALAANSYEPLTISTTAAAGTHDYSVRVAYGNSPGGIYSPTKTIRRTWVVNASTPIAANQVGLTFQYHDSTKGTNCNPAALMEEGHFVGAVWNVDPSLRIMPTGANPYTAGPFYPNSLDSSFVIGNQSSILEVKNSLWLKAEQNPGAVKLSWTTTLDPVEQFIERATGGINFQTLAKVVSAQRAYTDAQSLAGTNFYRVKAVQDDGQPVYSNIVKTTTIGPGTINIYPLQVTDITTVFINVDKQHKTNVVLSDMSGRTLIKKGILLNSGLNKVPLDLHAFAAGVYFVTVMLNEERVVKKVVKE